MNRRDFIGAIAAVLAAPAVAASATLHARGAKVRAGAVGSVEVGPLVATFDATREHGGAVHLTERTEKSVALAKELLFADARKYLPAGAVFYVLDGGTGRAYGKAGEAQEIDALAWYYSPRDLSEVTRRRVIAEVRMT